MLKQNIQDFFGKMNLQKRLFIYFIIVCIVPLITIGSISIFLSINSTRDSAIEFSDSTLLQVKTRIEAIMDVAFTLSQQLSDDLTVQSVLRKPLEKNVSLRYQTDLAMDTYLNYELNYIKEIYGFYIIGENKGKYKSAYNSFFQNDLTTTLWYQTIMSTQKPVWFSKHKNSQAVKTSGQHFISSGMRIEDKASNNDLGVILVDIDLYEIEKVLIDSFGDLGQVLLIDEKNRIIANSENLFAPDSQIVNSAITKLSENPEIVNLKSSIKNNLVLSKKLDHADWRLLAIIPSSLLLKDSIISVTILVVLLLIISSFTFIISKIITSTITIPINNMISLMKEVESGNLNVKTEVNYDDEIGRLSDSFNTMTNKVKTLMDKNVEEQVKLRKSELKALQSQINPHFLYNTLDSVVWLARMKQHEDIIKIISAITRLFRISLSRGNDIISIDEEISHVTNYLLIQKFRYRTQFNYSIDIPESITNYKTLKLIIQPLVENAIYHGIKLKREGGTISIVGFELEHDIIIKVIDTGAGMTVDRLNAIHEYLESGESNNITMYGIKNVNERIEIFFGKSYGLRFTSEVGKGTTAIIRIPKYSGDNTSAKNSYN